MDTALVGKNVRLGKKTTIEPFCLIGFDFPESQLTIGKNAHIRSHTVIYGGTTIGQNFQTGHHVLVREHSVIGSDVSVGSHTVIEHHVIIGNKVRIHSNAFIPEYSIVEDNCWIGPNVVFTNARYPRSRDVKRSLEGPKIRKGVKIGANATILPGITINEEALIGAGSVVTKDVPKRAVIAGNPGTIINYLDNLPYG